MKTPSGRSATTPVALALLLALAGSASAEFLGNAAGIDVPAPYRSDQLVDVGISSMSENLLRESSLWLDSEFDLPLVAELSAIEMVPAEPDAPPLQEAPFKVELLVDGRGVLLAGHISHGMTAQLESLLMDAAPFLLLELNSPGGLVAEARGLVRLIETYGLSTFVAEDCLSACTLAFASGRTRILAPGARLGFHRYHQRSPLVGLFMTAEAELERDMIILRRHSVAQSFIDRVADTPHETMWFPSPRELVAAGLVDMIADPR